MLTSRLTCTIDTQIFPTEVLRIVGPDVCCGFDYLEQFLNNVSAGLYMRPMLIPLAHLPKLPGGAIRERFNIWDCMWIRPRHA